jgi:CRISPR-associated protein Csb1
MAELTLDMLTHALHDGRASDFAAIRFRQAYEPAGGRGAKVYPPTYPRDGVPYIFERRFNDSGEPIETVLLDSIGSQANRVEEVLLDAVDEGRLKLPLLVLETTVHGRPLRLTSLEMPHRCSDAYLRDAVTHDGEPFDRTEIGRMLRRAALRDATIVYRACPTALVLGTWDSHRGRPELSFKAPRVYVSELYGVAPDRETGFRVGSRLDPVGMLGGRVRRTGQEPGDWELIEIEGEETTEQLPGAERVRRAETDKLSNVGHGNVAPSVDLGGVAISSAHRHSSVSLAGLRRLRFPVDGDRSLDRDAAGRTVLAALAIVGDRLAFGRADLSLRSGCDLVVLEDRVELVARGGAVDQVELSIDMALGLLQEALQRATDLGLTWLDDPIVLRPRENLQRALEANIPDV